MSLLPFLTAEVAPIGGVLRSVPDDFRVEEVPAYEPSGEGDHLYVTFEKRGLTTPAAVRAIAAALGVPPRETGYAGMKDRHAVTVQTASFLRADPDRALALAVPGVTVLAAKRHRNKLKTGHLRGNRFRVRLRGCAPHAPTAVPEVCARLLELGVANYYGEQRFGRDGDNAARARAWLLGAAPAPRDPFMRKLLVSALQSEVFNSYLAARVTDGLLGRYVDGDLAVRHPYDKSFAIEPAEAEVEYPARRCSATGPIFGRAMRWPERAAREREERALRASELGVEHFARAGDLGEGTRRPVRMCLDGLDAQCEPSAAAGDEPGVAESSGRWDVTLTFALPSGGYATAVVREFSKSDEQGLHSDDRLGIESAADDRAAATERQD